MKNWHDNVLRLIAEIDRCIRAREGETLTLAHLARLLDCSQSQVSHQFHALTGTSLRDFVQARRPALALPAVRDGEQRLLDIALDCGFSSQEDALRWLLSFGDKVLVTSPPEMVKKIKSTIKKMKKRYKT